MKSAAELLSSPLVAGAGRAGSRQRLLIQRLKALILSGQLPTGARLPPSRSLAQDLGVSRNTVLIAYEQLAAEGYIVASRQGTRVAALGGLPANAQPLPPVAPAPRFARRISHMDNARRHSQAALPMTVGTPALAHFPLTHWRRALDRAMHEAPLTLLGYGDPRGEPALRAAIAQYLRITRGVHCDTEQVVITEGAQEALALCVRLLSNPGDTAWVEEPGYRGAKAAFRAGDLDVVPMRVDEDGMYAAAKAWRARPPRLIYVTPSHQYPTGVVLSAARRLDMMTQARRIGAWIIEDDYDSEFRHHGAPIAAMQGLVPDAPVLYVGTYSKTMFPSLRLGFVVLPKHIAHHAGATVDEMLRGGHRHEQLALAHFIESGQFARHLGRMRRLYRDRQAALRAALAAQLHTPHTVLGGHSGLHLTVRLPPGCPDVAIVEQARQAGMNPGALSSFAMAPAAQDNGLVIGYGNTSAEMFAPLVKRLARIIHAQAAP